jgi:type IV secretory pathway VirB2 component (pilin)
MTADSAPDRSCRHSLFHRARRTGERDRGSDFAAVRRLSYIGSLFAFVPRSGESLPSNPDAGPARIIRKELAGMKKLFHKHLASRLLRPTFVTLWSPLILASAAFAQATGSSPWENAVNVLMTAFTSTIARGLSLVAIVVSGLTFAFGEGGSKRVLAGVLFGVGMAIAAVNFMAWLFP